jgi:hypothetical protein
MIPTQSEELFEQFCKHHRILCRRLPPASSRTPDYEIYLSRRKVIVEIKEITPNQEELEAERKFRNGERFIVVSSTPGERVRGKISNAVPQLKTATKGRFSGLLVLFDTGVAAEHTSPYNIRVAMHGFETHYLGVPKNINQPTYLIDKDFGKGKKTTPNSNTSLSAIAVLNLAKSSPTLLLYHNPHARVPLQLSSFAKYGVKQFGLQSKSAGQVPDWQEL